MPFMAEYVCDAGHRSEDLHMGSRETAPATIPCTTCEQPAVRAVGCWVRKPGKIDLRDYALKGQEPWRRRPQRVTDEAGRVWAPSASQHWR